MNRQIEDATAARMVALGYALDDPTDHNRCLGFRVAFNTTEGACAALRSIGDYNAFNGDAVAEALQPLAASGGGTRISVGREGSPVVYVGPFYSGDEEEQREFMEALRLVGADEIDLVGREIRAWWD